MSRNDPASQGKILVVDDAMENVRILHRALGDEYAVAFALDGTKALELARTQAPDLILLDAVMPGMDGYAVCAELRKAADTRSIPVIFVTALNGPEDETRALEAGAVDFIHKPINGAVVRARVRTHLALRRRSEEVRQANRELEARVAERTEEVRRLAAEATYAEERERQALARDLHDELGQILHVVKIKLGLLGREGLPATGQARLEEIGSLIGDASRQVRSLTSQLSPPILTQLGLPPALRWLCAEVQQTYGLSVACRADISQSGLSPAQAAVLFRAARELLINVAKHSGSNEAFLGLECRETALVMTVEDRGNGIRNVEEAMAGVKGFGLASVRDRIRFLGGEMQLEAPPEGGVRITLLMPLAAACQEARQ